MNTGDKLLAIALRTDSLKSLQLHIAVGSPVSTEEANDQRTLTQQVDGTHLDMVLVEQTVLGSAVPDFQRLIRQA
jgi:hypothetical protein